jgi:DNA-binding transcriptional ArsR family regulator
VGIAGLEKSSLYQAITEASFACGETAGILDIPYLRAAHQRRQRILEAAGSASLDGRPTSPDRLFAWLGDIPIQAQANFGAEGYAAELFSILVSPERGHPLAAEARRLAEGARTYAGRDPLAGAAKLFRGHDVITAGSRAAYSIFLRGVLGPAEPALSPVFMGLEAAAQRSASVFDSFIADRLAKGARRALANARTLRAGLAAAYGILGKARASSHVHTIAELLFAGHPLTIATTSKIFGISRLAARKHLMRLERDGLAEPAARRKSGIVYVARDGLMTFGQTTPSPIPRQSSRLAVRTSQPLSSDERSRLETVSDMVADRMHDLDRLLSRLATPNG